MNNNDVEQLKVDFLKAMKTDQLELAHQISKQILTIDPTNALILKCASFLEKHKNDFQTSSEEEEEEEQQENASSDPEGAPEAEEVIEPMYDEKKYNEQKKLFLQNISQYKDPSTEQIIDAIKKAQDSINQMGACIKSTSAVEPKFIQTRGVISVYYGTTSGNSSRLAYQFADSAKSKGYHPLIINLSDYDPEQLKASPLNVFFISTYGSGGPSADAEKFHDWLMSEERPNFLSNYYVLFGLGNTNHEHFCGMAHKVDEKFQKMGAKRIYEFGKGNSANETTETDYMAWVQGGLFEALDSQFPIKNIVETELKTQGSQFTYEFVNTLNECKTELQFMAQQYLSSEKFLIHNIYEMKKQPSLGNSTLFIDLKFNSQYKSAQNIAIYPENSLDDVLSICSMSNLNPNQIFKLTSKSKHAFPTPITIQDYLQKYHFKIYQDFVIFWAQFRANNFMLFRNISQMKRNKNYLDLHHRFKEFLKTKVSVLSIILKHKLKLDLLQIMELCPLISPRFFTIASSPKKYPNNIQLLCSQLIVLENRVGLCSKYLSSLKNGDYIRGYLVDSNFVYPQNKNAPILLIGPGAGLAPMRAFIQDKDQFIEEDKLDESPFQGPMTLYFGCKTKDDYLCQKELEEYLSNGTLSSLKVAVSREPNNIKYVTGFLSDDLKSIATFFDLGGVMYICGSQQMGKDVCNQIENMFKAVKKVAPYMAYKKVLELEKNKQLIKELWG